MAITKDKKKEILSSLDEVMKNSQSVTFVKFTGLTVGESTELRNKLREEGSGYKVMKKTLLSLSMKNAGVTGEEPALEGNIAIAYSADPIASARGVFEFGKKRKEQMTIVGGVFEGAFKNQEEMNEIATIPALQVLRGMFLNVINSPIQGLAIALDQIAEKKA
jgi:large subunit ribosomal protein L10